MCIEAPDDCQFQFVIPFASLKTKVDADVNAKLFQPERTLEVFPHELDERARVFKDLVIKRSWHSVFIPSILRSGTSRPKLASGAFCGAALYRRERHGMAKYGNCGQQHAHQADKGGYAKSY
ncbi:hypothetical protein WGT02_28400 (plasmid) [Rhizobium sp. T1470]|uniref:hypothetical protein n=1 Tax=unclassified Rhizobium TaxID=2613769 RepID=UPI0030D22077